MEVAVTAVVLAFQLQLPVLRVLVLSHADALRPAQMQQEVVLGICMRRGDGAASSEKEETTSLRHPTLQTPHQRLDLAEDCIDQPRVASVAFDVAQADPAAVVGQTADHVAWGLIDPWRLTAGQNEGDVSPVVFRQLRRQSVSKTGDRLLHENGVVGDRVTEAEGPVAEVSTEHVLVELEQCPHDRRLTTRRKRRNNGSDRTTRSPRRPPHANSTVLSVRRSGTSRLKKSFPR